MSNLVLELRQGEVMIVNGAPIRFRTKSRIELTAKARFLFGKQIMPPDQADSAGAADLFRPAIRLYRQRRGTSARPCRRETLIADFKAATTSALAREILDRALAAAEADDCYQALKLAGGSSATRTPCWRAGRPAQRRPTHSSPFRLNWSHVDDDEQATRAYQAAASHRSQREQEADVFRRAIGALKSARNGNAFQRVRALADNRRLWMTVHDLMHDPKSGCRWNCAPRSFPSA